MAFTVLKSHQSCSLAPFGSLTDLWCHNVAKLRKLMDVVSCDKDATNASFFLLILGLSPDSGIPPCPPHGCARSIVEVVFHCYFGHEIERVPVTFGDVRVPFVVRFHEKVAFFFFFSCVSRGKRFWHIFMVLQNTDKIQSELAAPDGKTDSTLSLKKKGQQL